jgi:hypothetical protein
MSSLANRMAVGGVSLLSRAPGSTVLGSGDSRWGGVPAARADIRELGIPLQGSRLSLDAPRKCVLSASRDARMPPTGRQVDPGRRVAQSGQFR